MNTCFNPDCQKCPRLAEYLQEVKHEHPDYFCKPVPPFGADDPELLIVGLAPGKHGANATGRPFTGDFAGILLYKALFLKGYSNQDVSSHCTDGLTLKNCRITNAVKCLPPENKPTGVEITTCNPYLTNEIAGLPPGAVILALGSIAHNAILKATGHKLSQYKFGHGNEHDLGKHWLVDSYHCSRYNTQTRRLTEAMFLAVFDRVKEILEMTRC